MVALLEERGSAEEVISLTVVGSADEVTWLGLLELIYVSLVVEVEVGIAV